MKKNILIISTSPRKGGNSEQLADAFAGGAMEAGHSVEKVSLYNKNIGFCRGCLTCQKTGQCMIHDDVEAIIKKMESSDVIVFATPVYFYEMCGQMKVMLDRTNPLFSSDYAFRDIYLLATAAEEEESAVNGTVNGLQGWLDCFEKTKLAGVIFAGGVTGPGEIKNHSSLETARDMGRAV